MIKDSLHFVYIFESKLFNYHLNYCNFIYFPVSKMVYIIQVEKQYIVRNRTQPTSFKLLAWQPSVSDIHMSNPDGRLSFKILVISILMSFKS